MNSSVIERALELSGPIVAIACDVPPVLAHEIAFDRVYEIRVEFLNGRELKKPFCVMLEINPGNRKTQWMHRLRNLIGQRRYVVSLVGEVVLEGCRFRAVARSVTANGPVTLQLKAL